MTISDLCRKACYAAGFALLLFFLVRETPTGVAKAAASPDPQIQAPKMVAGRGLLPDGNSLRINPAAVRSYLAGSASLSFGTIRGSGGCSSQNIPVVGAVIGDRVVVGAPAELLTYSLAMTYAVSAADTVTIRLCNYTSANIAPPSWTWNVDVVKSF